MIKGLSAPLNCIGQRKHVGVAHFFEAALSHIKRPLEVMILQRGLQGGLRLKRGNKEKPSTAGFRPAKGITICLGKWPVYKKRKGCILRALDTDYQLRSGHFGVGWRAGGFP